MPRESMNAKAIRLLASGAVSAVPARVFTVRGDHGLYTVTIDPTFTRCTCPAETRCSHIIACQQRLAAEQRAQAGVNDPDWVRTRYEEAKELIETLHDDVRRGLASVPDDVCDAIEDFRASSSADRCATMGADCGCNAVDDK